MFIGRMKYWSQFSGYRFPLEVPLSRVLFFFFPSIWFVCMLELGYDNHYDGLDSAWLKWSVCFFISCGLCFHCFSPSWYFCSFATSENVLFPKTQEPVSQAEAVVQPLWTAAFQPEDPFQKCRGENLPSLKVCSRLQCSQVFCMDLAMACKVVLYRNNGPVYCKSPVIFQIWKLSWIRARKGLLLPPILLLSLVSKVFVIALWEYNIHRTWLLAPRLPDGL